MAQGLPQKYISQSTRLPVLIDSPIIMSGVFQRCRHAKPDSGELLALVNDILSIVDQQGKLLIDVPEGWVPDKWVKAVNADTQRGIEYMHAMKISDYDALSPEKRRVISLLQLLVRELQRLWATGAKVTVQCLGHAFHNIARWLRTPEKPGADSSMRLFRIISANWEELSMEMREGCCRVVGLELQAAEALINTPGFSVNTWGDIHRK